MTPEPVLSDHAAGARLLEMYRMMLRIRLFEQLCMELRERGEVLGNTFPALGQEAFCAIGMALEETDAVFPSYRSRPLVFGMGVTVEQHFRELIGSAQSLLAGREVFHHSSWPRQRVMPGSSMIGGWVPMAAGHALAQQLDRQQGITVCAVGDGILGAGDVYEALNLIGLWKLPVLIICENNGYQVSAGWQAMRKHRNLGEYAKPFGFRVMEADGNDPLALYQLTREVRALVGSGTPVLVDCFTYRQGGYSSHIGEPRRGHEAEMREWLGRDPILQVERRAVAQGLANEAALAEIRSHELTEIHAAWNRVRAEGSAGIAA